MHCSSLLASTWILFAVRLRIYVSNFKVMSASEARIGETIEGFYHDSSEAALIATGYKRALEELDARTAKELDVPYRATVLDPVGKLCSYFPEINKIIDKRGRKVRCCFISLTFSYLTTMHHGHGLRKKMKSIPTLRSLLGTCRQISH